MMLKDLLQNLQYECVKGNLDREITQVVYDSRKLCEGCLFLCIVGANFDGHSFAAEAVEKGAKVLVVSKEVEVPADADVTIFNPEALKDGATFESPMIAPTGVDYVLIGGEIAAKDCEIVNPACGTAIRAH